MESNSKTNDSESAKNSLVRQHMVNTAVHFLLNPDIINRADDTKIMFLQKKGLTEAEISAAFDQAKANPKLISSNKTLNHNSFIPTIPYNPPVPSLWLQIQRISSSIIVLGTALYGLHSFYKAYLEPWLFGRDEDPTSQIKEQLVKMNDSLLELRATIITLEDSVKAQKDRIHQITEESSYLSAPAALSALKSEIGNVKSLLINRHQFPAVPKLSSPSIPHWQLSESADSGSASKDNKEKEGDEHLNPSIVTILDDLNHIHDEVPADCNGVDGDDSPVETFADANADIKDSDESFTIHAQVSTTDVGNVICNDAD